MPDHNHQCEVELGPPPYNCANSAFRHQEPPPSPVLSTSAQSPDSLPLVGYSIDQLSNYIFRKLGAPTWNIELTQQQVIDCINDATAFYSQWKPQLQYGSVMLIENKFKYLEGDPIIPYIVKVDFVEAVPTPTEIYYGNLITPAPLLMRGLDEFDGYQRWRKTWMRVISASPDWLPDTKRKILWIHNAIARYRAGIIAYVPHRETEHLPEFGAIWVKEYSLALAKVMLNDVWQKFEGAIPAPGRDIKLSSRRGEKAEEKVKELEERLRASQESSPASID